jgi:S-adenosylmethionine decarboxylase
MTDTLSSKLSNLSMVPVGTHCILELYDCPEYLLNDVVFIKQALQTAAQHAQSTLLDEVSHEFSPHGVTALALLAESHISVHTWPELGYMAADVFTCGQHTRPESACQYLLEVFEARHHRYYTLPRGRLSSELHHVQTKTLLTRTCPKAV